jgi:hypothetical protein
VSDLIGAFEAFSVGVITEVNVPLPARVELMDISAEPFIEIVAEGPDQLGIWSFKRNFPPGTAWKQGPHTARFTTEGMQPFLRDFPWSPVE